MLKNRKNENKYEVSESPRVYKIDEENEMEAPTA